jgi:hypothetical protein
MSQDLLDTSGLRFLALHTPLKIIRPITRPL